MMLTDVASSAVQRAQKPSTKAERSQPPLAKTAMVLPAEPMAAGGFRVTGAVSLAEERPEVIAAIFQALEIEDGLHWQAIDKRLSKLCNVPFGPYLMELRHLVQLGRLRQDGDRYWLNRPR